MQMPLLAKTYECLLELQFILRLNLTLDSLEALN